MPQEIAWSLSRWPHCLNATCLPVTDGSLRNMRRRLPVRPSLSSVVVAESAYFPPLALHSGHLPLFTWFERPLFISDTPGTRPVRSPLGVKLCCAQNDHCFHRHQRAFGEAFSGTGTPGPHFHKACFCHQALEKAKVPRASGMSPVEGCSTAYKLDLCLVAFGMTCPL